MPGPVVTVGKYCERASLTMARAAMKLANAAATFWFDRFTWSSRVLSWGSLNISHHFPCNTSSFGCATFQPSVFFISSGVSSLYASGVGADGLWYFGPTVQPSKTSSTARASATTFAFAPHGNASDLCFKKFIPGAIMIIERRSLHATLAKSSQLLLRRRHTGPFLVLFRPAQAHAVKIQVNHRCRE